MKQRRALGHLILCISIACWISISSVLDARADNAPPPIMTEASADSALSALTVRGANFGTNGVLTLAPYGSLLLESYTSGLITADLPPGVSPGSYLLTLTVGNKTEEFWVTLGAVGPQGPAGPAGPSGLAALAGMSCPTGQAIVGFSSTGGLICAPFATGTGGGGGGTLDTDGDGIPDSQDQCPLVPNVTDNGISYCPVSIYDITSGIVSQGMLVAISNALVTAVNGTTVTIAIVDGDPGYNGADGSSLTIDVGALPVPAISSRVNVFGTALANDGLAPADLVFVFNAACLANPCTDPPANYCDGTTLVTYMNPGTCTIVGTAAVCQYATTSTANGCSP